MGLTVLKPYYLPDPLLSYLTGRCLLRLRALCLALSRPSLPPLGVSQRRWREYRRAGLYFVVVACAGV